MEFSAGNILKMPQILKIPELVRELVISVAFLFLSILKSLQALSFITLMVARLGNDGNPVSFGYTTDAYTFGVFVVYAFFFIVLLQLVSILFGDRSPVLVRLP